MARPFRPIGLRAMRRSCDANGGGAARSISGRRNTRSGDPDTAIHADVRNPPLAAVRDVRFLVGCPSGRQRQLSAAVVETAFDPKRTLVRHRGISGIDSKGVWLGTPQGLVEATSSEKDGSSTVRLALKVLFGI